MNDTSPAGGAAPLDVAIAHKDHRRADGRPLRALEDLRLALPFGQAGAVVGPSGCGKTTLLRLIAGLDRDFSGHIHLPAHGRLGMVFQEPRLLPWRSVADNIRIAAPGASEEEIAALLAELSLAEHAAHFPGELSLGLARRVSLARALAVKPDLLLLDEPFVSLDAALARDLRERIAALIDEKRITTLIVTHDIAEAVALADRIFLLSPRPARVVETLEIETPRKRMSPETARALEARAHAALTAAHR
ncbi:ABC transporter ATP-binding protein [Methylocystis parvus]|uniref:ATP-binding cassette domain-containing protein n=1 Tax=Methylocystis parvus TaxID=134 RepID=A0A6B8MBN6_9HYPH|nr:ATP-binding cassette domain-containing protein [Methylocystis parvus]QGM98040.1 ATP-binding cassette domain-containing protein [Methylocystis parvus]WBK01643.1 ATP-binding cassette domain-containing protein [Methylocystis parvus OBBP]